LLCEVVVVDGWLVVLAVVALALLLRFMIKGRSGGAARSRDIVGGDGTRNVGERWRTGGYGEGGGGP
jgi:hypothetical protein